MQAVERSAWQAEKQRLTPVAGGNSVGGNGAIPIPTNVPEVVQRVIAGANAITDFPYVFGGGHASFVDNAYDCSGSVSYALAAGGLISVPQTSGELETWGAPGPGRYITVYANAGHTYMYVNGMLYDTAGRSGVYASRWQVSPTDNSGYVARHWPGL
jgi:cell wall-associated NlpC family hydrolase